uniref:RNA-directed DNA polymerase n=1 Tax=Panagrolaimus superbus TaxID=310955 RepID=A0A914XSF5_9BILA
MDYHKHHQLNRDQNLDLEGPRRRPFIAENVVRKALGVKVDRFGEECSRFEQDGIYDNDGKAINIDNDISLMDGNNAGYKKEFALAPVHAFVGMIGDEDFFGSGGGDDLRNVVNQPPVDEEDHIKETEDAEPKSIANARSLVAEAREFCVTITAEIRKANVKLKTMNHPRDMIDEESIETLNSMLNGSLSILLEGMLSREASISLLQQDFNELNSYHQNLKEELAYSDSVVARLQNEQKGLSAGTKKRLIGFGCNTVEDLINKHMILQDRFEVLERNIDNRSRISGDSRATSHISLTEKCLNPQAQLMQMEKNKGMSFFIDKKGVSADIKVQLPMPEKFTGKSRTELERFFKLYEAGTNSRGWGDDERAVFLGSYIPRLQLYHDSLTKRNASYKEMKEELLNALGSDGAIATFNMRSQLDRVTKAPNKLYKQLFEEIEMQVTEAFGADCDSREDELKKILLRLTEDDPDPVYRTVVITNVNASYFKLKELVLGMEASQVMHKKVKSEGIRSSLAKANVQVRSSTGKSDVVTPKPQAGGQQSGSGSQQSFSRPQGGSGCFQCHKPGHLARDCPERKPEGTNYVKLEDMKLCVSGIVPVGNVDAKGSLEEPLFGKQALLDVWFDGFKVNALMDSGASTSIIKDTVVGQILSAKDKDGCRIVELPRESYEDKRLIGADGNALMVVNCVKIPIAWGTCPTKVAKFFVVRGLQQNALIGTNVLQDDAGWIEALGSALKSGVKGIQSVGVVQESQKQAFINRVGYDVVAAKTIVIPPQTKVFVKVKTPKTGSVSLIESKRVGIESGVCRSRKGAAWMEFSNQSNELEVVEKGEVVGEAWPTRIVHDIPVEGTNESILTVEADEGQRSFNVKELLDLSAPAFSAEGKLKLTHLVEKYHQAFAASDDEFGKTTVTEHVIDTGDARPIKQPARPVPVPMIPEVKRLVESLLKQRAIERSSSPWNSPVVLVMKKDGSIRMCVDYRRLNAVTKKDAYPLPNQDALLMSLRNKKFFTALDLASGYYQIPMADKDKYKTAFSVLGELFHFLVLPFGMSTSPACFNRMMRIVFGDLIGESVFVYLDDILLATETEVEHLFLLEEILRRLIKFKLMLKPKKCEIARTELCYLGHVISDRGVELGKDKVAKVQNFPPPRSVSQVRQFIGLASYHRKFIQGFSTIASPLLALTRKDTKFCWGDTEQEAFDALKEKLVTAPILAQPDYESAIDGSKPFIIWTDASKTGVGAVLTQEDDDKRLHPLFYVSKACSEAERNYSITQLEALAVVVAMRKLRTLVMGAKVIIRTDHQPLMGLVTRIP